MKNAKIRTKFILCFGFLLALIIALNGFSLVNIRKTSNQVEQLYNGAHMQSLASVALTQELFGMESAVQRMVISGSASAGEEAFQRARKAADADLAIFDQEDAQITAVKSALAEMDLQYERLKQALGSGNTSGARISLESFQQAVQSGERAAQALSTQSNADAAAFLAANSRYTNQVILIQDLIFLGIAVLAIVTSLRLSSGIAKPIRRVAGGVAEIAQGKLDTRMQPSSGDEIGQLTQQLNDTMQTISTYVAEIDVVLGEIGRGNIDLEVTREYVGDFNSIRVSLNRIVKELNHTMGQIQDCCAQVRAGSEQLAENAEQLSRGAETQRTYLEEFRISLGRVAELTAGDAKNAAAVKGISEQVNSRALDGARQMDLMMGSMNEISTASSEIEKVIKIIEDIAFQTNILALNASIEAARAGTAGKGFAVVADEVGNLAAKSAEASKSTAEMIRRSISAVDGGLRNAKASSQTMGLLRTLVEQMAQRLVEIDQSTTEQDQAFQAMLQALEQIFAVVTANSGAAGENSAASEELSAQAEMLEQLVSHFQLKKAPMAGQTMAAGV